MRLGWYNRLMSISTKFTHADLLGCPEDNKRREIIDGELFVTPAPRIPHQTILVRLTAAIQNYLSENPVGTLLVSPMDVIFSNFDVLEPDLLLVLNERKEILKDWVRGAPDLVVEILSPTTEARDRGIKLKAYGRFGVQEYWIVDPDARAVEIYRLAKKSYKLVQTCRESDSLTSSLLPGFSCPLTSIFPL